VLSFVELAARSGVRVTAVTCRGDRRDWSDPESPGDYRMVLVQRGRFHRRGRTGPRSGPAEIDRGMAYVGTPDEEERFAHPDGGDVCTAISLTPERWATLAGDGVRLTRPVVTVDPRLDLAHRRVLAAAGTGDIDYALTEELLAVVGRVVAQAVSGPTPAAPGPGRADPALVTAARRAIEEDHPSAGGLFSLAEQLGVSPYTLSRAFTRELGVSLTRYRNRVRLTRALDRLEQGEPSLATLAADLGFADQAHLTRTMTEHLGHPPTTLRRLLTKGRAPS
jgi:AraC-like DNA-binding protein